MPPVGFEPTISAGERPQTYALDRAATETGHYTQVSWENSYTLQEVRSKNLLEMLRLLTCVREVALCAGLCFFPLRLFVFFLSPYRKCRDML